MIKRSEIVSHRIVRLLRGTIRIYEQEPTPGIPNRHWKCFDIYVELDNGMVVGLEQVESTIIKVCQPEGLFEFDKRAVPEGVIGCEVTNVLVPRFPPEVWLELDGSRILFSGADWYGSGVLICGTSEKLMPRHFVSPWIDEP